MNPKVVSVRASAPGKLLLLGEYAVLDGAPAVVMAVDRRARVRLTMATSAAAREIAVHAPDLGLDASGALDAGGAIRWRDERVAERLGLVTTVFRRSAATPAGELRTNPLDIRLDTSEFFESPGRKIGLGSSAALTVALTAALSAWYGHPPPSLADLVAAHRELQGGRGSGADVGAAVMGGLTIYRGAHTGTPQAQHVTLPDEIRLACVYTGRSASTGDALARLAAWRDRAPAAYRTSIQRLAAIAEAGAAAVAANDADALLAAAGAYGDGLAAFGRSAGIDIVSNEHRELRNAADRCGVIYKPSGAGGGDIGIAFSRDADHNQAFDRAATNLGYRMIDLATSGQGLDVSVTTSDRNEND